MKCIVGEAYTQGYRLFDLAAAYGNENAFRKAIAENGIPRDQSFCQIKSGTPHADMKPCGMHASDLCTKIVVKEVSRSQNENTASSVRIKIEAI